MSPNLFIGSDKLEILDLGAAKSKLDENLLVPLTGLKYLFVQFNIISKISTRNELGNLFDNPKWRSRRSTTKLKYYNNEI